MTHVHFQPDVISTTKDATSIIKDNTLILDFFSLPVGKLVTMRQITEGLSADECDSWIDAATAATIGLTRYLDKAIHPVILRDGHELHVRIDGDINDVTSSIIAFFRRKGIMVESPSNLRLYQVDSD
ncbi:MAG TPA: hypothetical protein VFM68_01925 [Candidatus Saccharimonadales bacterium]|nr:hypothetical protein [Candidatus Saccharimonadales bacterium]